MKKEKITIGRYFLKKGFIVEKKGKWEWKRTGGKMDKKEGGNFHQERAPATVNMGSCENITIFQL